MDGVWIPILAIVFGCSIPIVAIWSKHKQQLAAMKLGIILDDKGKPVSSANSNAELKAEVEILRDRVHVLERIVTDGGYNLANEIEQLRDASSSTGQGSGVPLSIDTKERA